MHEDHAEKKCQTGDTFKRLMIKVDTEVAKDRRDHGVAQNDPCVVIMDWVGSHLDDDELKRVGDAEIRLANLYYFVARPHIPLATGTHFIKSGLPVCPVFPFRAVYSSKTSTLRRFTQFMQFMQTEQFMQFMRFVLVYQKTGPDRSRPVLEQTA